ncbi:Poly(U)-specific endoribonuclease -like protein [Trichinella pseudospiralis]|uniref:Poly(U)-specific endoribonuclease-like protein n=2 Tax=Trichinella pseudospiralis TaxID=6337 RepID=A0A0V1IP41_TRIPS|nr:Poly(U)-specific endoribonuclease -like protein [Trichinella pseudospiralis]KRZ24515.1 Poly(U)-specific endoribonuclease -like protein [Trichinella pseudospiralis]
MFSYLKRRRNCRKMYQLYYFSLLQLVISCFAVANVTDDELIELSVELGKIDDSFAKISGVTLNLQRRYSQDSTSSLHQLFGQMPADVKLKPSVAAFVELFEYFIPETGKKEIISEGKSKTIHNFINAVVESNVMKMLMQFLRDKNVTEASSEYEFKKYLQTVWFQQYSRKNNVLDSCAFEHTFLGEISNKKVMGMHNWIRMAYLEKTGKAQYNGYYSMITDKYLSISFTWNKATKQKSGFLLRTSPEYEMALYTMCYIFRNEQDCIVKFGSCTGNILTYSLERRNKSYLSTAYFVPNANCKS